MPSLRSSTIADRRQRIRCYLVGSCSLNGLTRARLHKALRCLKRWRCRCSRPLAKRWAALCSPRPVPKAWRAAMRPRIGLFPASLNRRARARLVESLLLKEVLRRFEHDADFQGVFERLADSTRETLLDREGVANHQKSPICRYLSHLTDSNRRPLLTMEDSGRASRWEENGSQPGFPCIYAVLAAGFTPSLKLPEDPRELPDLSPRPVPKRNCGARPLGSRRVGRSFHHRSSSGRRDGRLTRPRSPTASGASGSGTASFLTYRHRSIHLHPSIRGGAECWGS
jgi:hypothetical protein